MLSYLDSNQDKQNQNLLCYHYTIGQSLMLSFEERCKGISFWRKCQIISMVFVCDHFLGLYGLNEFTASITLITSLSLIAG